MFKLCVYTCIILYLCQYAYTARTIIDKYITANTNTGFAQGMDNLEKYGILKYFFQTWKSMEFHQYVWKCMEFPFDNQLISKQSKTQ